MSLSWNDFQGVNAAAALELYDRFRADPASVDEATRAFFERVPPPTVATALGARSPATGAACPPAPHLVVGAVNLAQSIRRYGHLAAEIDPLGSRPMGDPALRPETHGVTETTFARFRHRSSTVPWPRAPTRCGTSWSGCARSTVRPQATTSRTSSFLRNGKWLTEVIETGRYRAPNDPIDPIALLDRLTDVETFERFLHRTFPGKTRFSIEGLDMLVPILDEVIAEAAESGIRQAFIGMAHRGRLNVMAHVLGKSYDQILAEFKDPVRGELGNEGIQWSGDVKYHLGASRAVAGGERVELVVSMPPNPSHLEAINPVLEGMARAAGTDASKPGPPTFNPDAVLPILIHGDAAFPGQGVVAETLNLHRLDGYTTGGTIHIIANNQIGFTTDPSDSASTLYASGVARGFKIPIVHVNADDPEACVSAARLAFAYRMKFRRDVLIDLVGYRRYGHNEGDEPAFTQPVLYRKVSEHPTVRDLWARTLETRGIVESGRAQSLANLRLDGMQRIYDALDPEKSLVEALPEIAAPGTAAQTKTAVTLGRLKALNESLLAVPGNFTVHRKLDRGRERRRQAFASSTERTIDWAAAEELALASILEDGTPIRLTGEDVERGTFSHRHAVLFDAQHGDAVLASAGDSSGEGVLRDLQQPAHRERRDWIRVRL